MGFGDIVEQAVDDACNDMYGTVQPAVDAISAAIKKVQPLLNSGTWQGPAATAWIGDWNSFYSGVMRLLATMPGAEASVISGVRDQMEKIEKQQAERQSA
ncbi:MAG TPA: hypothetical protein VGI58_12595 [Streptosporangiaceae bacterium]|jgi:hypothetical protein